MDDSLACLLPEGSSPQNPTWSDRALQRKHRSPEQDYHRLRSLPGGSVRRCPVCVPRTARNGSSRHSHQARAAILAGPSVSESRVFTQPGTLAGALPTSGARHAGSRRHRHYPVDSVYLALVLNYLAEWGLPIGTLRLVSEAVSER